MPIMSLLWGFKPQSHQRQAIGSKSCPPLQGIGIDEILEAIVKRVPAPKDTRKERLRALIFDSYYDAYKVRVNQSSPAL